MSESHPPFETPCRIVGGVVTSPHTARLDPLIERARATWTAGDFGRIAASYAAGAAEFVERLSLLPGESVLDVACGTGNLTLPAARSGAAVTGLDIAPNLLEAARGASAAARLDIRFDVGAAEALPYRDGAFDTVMSMFGVMFSSRPELALCELVRVTRPGGRIVLASWTPDGFIGSMLRLHTAHVPPPEGIPTPLAWGDEAVMRERLAAHAPRIRTVHFLPRTIAFDFPMPPGDVVGLFRGCYGPSVRAFGALDPAGRASLEAALRRLWSEGSRAPEGRTSVAAEYLEVRVDMA